jgi:hypothetical protein
VEVACARVQASVATGEAAAVCDGSLDTWWRTPRPQQRGDAMPVPLQRPARVARIELLLGSEGRFAARQLRLETSADGGTWEPAHWLPGRAGVDSQPAGVPRSQVLLLPSPRPVRALRLVQTGLGWRRRWGMAELRVWELP